MKKRILFAVIPTLILAALPLWAAPAGRESHRPMPSRIVSMSENGSTVTMNLEDGRSITAPQNAVRIVSRDAAMKGKAKEMTVATLSAMSSAGSLPAIATAIYGKDGTLHRVRIRVFDSNDAASAFLKGNRKAAGKAGTGSR